MKTNQNIVKARKLCIIILMAFIALQIIFFIFAFLFNIPTDGGGYDGMIKTILLVFFGISVIVCAAVDIYFWHRYIYGMGKLLNIEPVQCTVENFIITYTKKNKSLKYWISPVVRNNIDDRLYITLGRLSISWYKDVYSKSGRSLSSIKILRSDGTEVKIGDTVYLYITEIVNPNIVIDRKSNTVFIGKDKMKFSEGSNSVSIDIFDRLTYFKGAVEVDTPDYT